MELSLSQWYKVLAPRSVVLVSTVNLKGVSNAAPFSFVMPISYNPPLIAVASSPDHHTVKNILKTGDFVVNVPSYEILKELFICAGDFPAGVSEIKKANLTEEKSTKVKSPGIKECFARFECKLFKKYVTGDHLLIVGKILRAYVRDDYFSGGKYLITRANPLTHIGGSEFGLLGKVVKAK